MLPQTVAQAIDTAEHQLASEGLTNARWDAERLLAFLLGLNRIELYLAGNRPLTGEEFRRYGDLIRRRVSGVDLEDVRGIIRFRGLDLDTNAAVFVPHQTTEILVVEAVKTARELAQPRVIDLGTGNGAIALSIAVEVPQALVWAVDIVAEAVRLARQNAEKLDLSARVQVLPGNLFQPLPVSLKGATDLIVSNPPFRPAQDIDRIKERFNFTPSRSELAAGKDGLSYHQLIVNEATRFLKPGGSLIMEIDPKTSETLQSLFDNRWQEAHLIKDEQGFDRLVEVQLAGS